MESSVSSNFEKTGSALTDKTADKVQSGIRSAQDTAKDAGHAFSSKMDDLRSEAGTTLSRAAGRAQSMGKQGLDAIIDMASQTRDVVSDTSQSIVAYTKKNPAKALTIAAASGALIYAAIKLVAPSRDRKRTP
jgi:ElaB/YqjD/DUF883 family membrane-anchored ribosome-binding protein